MNLTRAQADLYSDIENEYAERNSFTSEEGHLVEWMITHGWVRETPKENL